MYMYYWCHNQHLHCAHVRIKTREDDFSSVGAAVDSSEDEVGHEVPIVVVNVRGGHVLARVGVLDFNVETYVTRYLLEQLQRGRREERVKAITS